MQVQVKISGVGCGDVQVFVGNKNSERMLLTGEILFAIMTPEYLLGGPARMPLLQNLHRKETFQLLAFDEIHCAINWR